jgi:hypothetical protein
MASLKIIFDLDGVFVDFVRGSFELHKKSVPYLDCGWDFVSQLDIPSGEFWKPLGREFWATLPHIQQAWILLDAAVECVGKGNVFFASSPCPTEGCIEGKKDWVAKWLPEYTNRLWIGLDKRAFAGPCSLLVDDRLENLNAFVEAGGHSFRIPQPWNSSSAEIEIMRVDGGGPGRLPLLKHYYQNFVESISGLSHEVKYRNRSVINSEVASTVSFLSGV